MDNIKSTAAPIALLSFSVFWMGKYRKQLAAWKVVGEDDLERDCVDWRM